MRPPGAFGNHSVSKVGTKGGDCCCYCQALVVDRETRLNTDNVSKQLHTCAIPGEDWENLGYGSYIAGLSATGLDLLMRSETEALRSLLIFA